jgi:hypothetical protein
MLGDYSDIERKEICDICLNFVSANITNGCPCFNLGSCQNAVKQSWLALEERGYI